MGVGVTVLFGFGVGVGFAVGAAVGDLRRVSLPAGDRDYEILTIRYPAA